MKQGPTLAINYLKLTLALVFWVFFLAACTQTKNQAVFKNLITNDGLKLFELQLPTTKPQRLSIQSNNRQKPEISEQRVMRLLEQLLSENHFCREGYMLLGRYAGETTKKIRGECQEKATKEDIALYPNTIKQW